MKLPRLIQATWRGGHRVHLVFADGAEGELDLADDLAGAVFEPLRDPTYFARFLVDDTLTWPNGAAFAPEFLHERMRAATPRPRPAHRE